MTVRFIPVDLLEPHRAFATRRDDPEPSLSDLFNDPTLQTLMARDGVERSSLERLVQATRGRLRLPQPAALATELFEVSLFAECRAA